MKQAGVDGLSPEQLVRMRDHGVTGEYVKKMRSKLGAEISIEEIVRLRDHGIE
jgi:hypothetical protein